MGDGWMNKAQQTEVKDARYMEALTQVVVEEWERLQPALQRHYELRALVINGVDHRPGLFLEEALKTLEILGKFIREQHSTFLADKPQRPLLKEWQDLAAAKLGLCAAYCSVTLDQAVNAVGRADPEVQRQWIKRWDDKWVPFVQQLVQQLATQTTLKMPRGEEPKDSWVSLKLLIQESAKTIIGIVVTAIVGLIVIYWQRFKTVLPYLTHWLHTLFQ
jgi:hypothetical protein